MTYERLAYDDAAPTAEMLTDAAAVGRTLRLPPEPRAEPGANPKAEPLPGRDGGPVAAPTPVVTDDLAELAADLELHLG